MPICPANCGSEAEPGLGSHAHGLVPPTDARLDAALVQFEPDCPLWYLQVLGCLASPTSHRLDASQAAGSAVYTQILHHIVDLWTIAG